MGFYLYLVNHNSKSYTVIAKGSFSRERRYFALPSGWSREDDMEIMTEYVFNEQLKNRSSYDEVDQFEDDHETESDDSEDSDSGNRDYKKSKYTSNKKTNDKKASRSTHSMKDRSRRGSHKGESRKKESRDPLLSMPNISRARDKTPVTPREEEKSSIPDAPKLSVSPSSGARDE